MAAAKEEAGGASLKRDREEATNSSDEENNMLRNYGKVTDEFQDIAKHAQSWTRHSCHRSDVSRDVRKSKD
eukprot:12181614-Alexandrium_andersonii.AAC.1